MKSNDLETADEEDRTAIGPSTNVRLGLVIVIASGLAWIGWVTSELNTIKTSLGRLDTIGAIQGELKGISTRVENIERRGSDPMQLLQKTVDKLAEDLRVHQAMTEKALKTQ